MTEQLLPTVQELLGRTEQICSPPLIYNRLQEAVNHPRTSVKDIARIVSEDSGLTARILKLANSPLYGRSGIDSISRAVTLLGTHEIRDIALAASITNSFPCISASLLPLEFFWKHSVACGVVARNLAQLLRESVIERYFIAGILHDIGHIIICAAVPHVVEQTLALADVESLPFDEAEIRLLGFSHNQLGAQLLSEWGLPDNITDLIHYHHQPSAASDYSHEVAIIHLADIICQATNRGTTLEYLVTRLDHQAYAVLQLPPGELEPLLNQSDRELAEIFSILVGS